MSLTGAGKHLEVAPVSDLSNFLLTPLGFSSSFAVALLWLAGVIAASILFRRGRGKPIFPRVPPDAIFAERTASGASRKNLLTRIGGARNCLMVCVTPERVTIGPWFPFTLLFLPEIYDLDHSIPLSVIRGVREKRLLFLFRTLALTFELPNGQERTVELYLRRADAFLEALGRDKRLRPLIIAT